jgi:hypothetical protein
MRIHGGTAARAAVGLETPQRPDDLAAHYDLTVGHPRDDRFAHFDASLAEAAAERGLSCALVHDGVVVEATHRIEAGRMRVGCHLDCHALWHVAGDPYARLAEAVQDAGGRAVNAPARSRAFTDRAAAHAELLRHGLGVPPAVIVRPWSPARPLTLAERDALRLDESGSRVRVKPANGHAASGPGSWKRIDPEDIETSLVSARQADRSGAFLVQREVQPPLLACEDGVARPACWRVIGCVGEWTAFWCQTQDRLRPVTAAELRRHRLQPVLAYARALGELTGLEWLSAELCLGDGPDFSRITVPGPDGRPRPVLAIDGVSDRCDLAVQGRWPGGLPDAFVRRVAGRFAEEAWRLRRLSLRPECLAPCPAAA